MPLDPLIEPRDIAALPNLVLVDCRPDDKAYLAAHVRGAHHAQLERDLSLPAQPAHGGRHPLPAVHTLATTLGRWGVMPDSHVVAYDEQGGANAAARLWWLLRALGHTRVQVVDGGLPGLLAAGFELTHEPTLEREASPYPATTFAWPTADIDEVDAARGDVTRRVIDVRARERYRGEHEPIDPIAGHIPGSINVPLSRNLGSDGKFKSSEALHALYSAALDGIAPAQAVVHCGSGVTACHTLLAMERAGLHGAKLYVGSWSEWCRNPERPREP
jgi:thiosulfate/3-mercaptopyruvate sulfurtransferase